MRTPRKYPAKHDLDKTNELLESGQAAEALKSFEPALKADPSSVDAHLGLGRAYYALGEYSSASIEFESVLQYDNLPRRANQLPRRANQLPRRRPVPQ